GHDRLLDRVVHVVDRDDRAVLLAEAGHHRLAVRVEDRGRLGQGQLVRRRHTVDVVRASDHHDAGQHDEDRETRDDQVTDLVLAGEEAATAATALAGPAGTPRALTARIVRIEVVIAVVRSTRARSTGTAWATGAAAARSAGSVPTGTAGRDRRHRGAPDR